MFQDNPAQIFEFLWPVIMIFLRFMPLLRVKKQRIWAAACLLRAVRMLSWAKTRTPHLDWGIPRFPKSDISKVGGCISAHLLQYSIHGTTWHNTLDIANTQYIQELSSLLKCQLNFNLWNKFQNRYIFIINQTKLTKPILMVSWHILTVGCCVTSKVWLLASAMAFPTLRRPLFAGLVRPTQGRWETRSWICWT